MAVTGTRLPRWLAFASYPVAAGALIAFFVVLGFPYDLLATRLNRMLETSSNVRVEIGELGPALSLGGPGLAAREVLATPQSGRAIVLERLFLRPAWSLSWLRGSPALHLDLRSDVGAGAGTLTLGSSGGWDGTLEQVRLDMLPIPALAALDVDGMLDATVDLHRSGDTGPGGLVGSVDFDLRDGTLSSSGLPVALPFERLHGRLDFGGETAVLVREVRLEGPMLEGSIEGSVGRAPSPGQEPLDLQLAFQVRDPGLAQSFARVGRRTGDGRRQVRVTGTLSRPNIR